MSKKVLIRKEAGGGIMYTRDIGRGQGGGFRQDLAALRGGAMGLNPQGGQSFIPGAQLPGAAPTRMQRLGAGANLAGRGLAAALTGLQTAYGLQGGNVGALGSVADTYAQNVPGLTRNNPTEAQQGQNIATEAYNQNQQAMAQNAVQQSAQQIMNPNQSGPTGNPLPGQTQGTPLGQLSPPAGLPAPPVPAQPAAQQTAPAVTDIAGPLSQFGVGEQPAQPVQPVPPMQPQTITGHNTVQTNLQFTGKPISSQQQQAVQQQVNDLGIGPQAVGEALQQGNPPPTPVPPYMSPQGNPYPLGTQESRDWAANNIRTSFVQAIYDEMGDALYKADPHVAGLIISRIYMDKFVR